MTAQNINNDKWYDEFGRTLHGDPSDIWTEVLAAGNDGDQQFIEEDEGFELAFEFYVRKIHCRSKWKRHDRAVF